MCLFVLNRFLGVLNIHRRVATMQRMASRRMFQTNWKVKTAKPSLPLHAASLPRRKCRFTGFTTLDGTPLHPKHVLDYGCVLSKVNLEKAKPQFRKTKFIEKGTLLEKRPHYSARVSRAGITRLYRWNDLERMFARFIINMPITLANRPALKK